MHLNQIKFVYFEKFLVLQCSAFDNVINWKCSLKYPSRHKACVKSSTTAIDKS